MMKRILMFALVVAMAAAAQNTPAQTPSSSTSAQPAQPAPQHQQTKEIKDPQEYNAYLGAYNQTNDNAKAVALEGFLQQYPNSVVKVDALELLMATYQRLGNVEKVVDAANRLLQADPTNLRALTLMAYMKRQQGEQGGPAAQQNWADAKQYAQRGLQADQTATKPDGMSDADFEKLKAETSTIFNGVLGMAALQVKDYETAQQHLQQAVDKNPNNLADVYPLALAYIQAPQPNFPQGIWYLARAANLAGAAKNTAAQQQLTRYGVASYVKYHGTDQGWDQVLQAAATNPAPPAGFSIQPRPTPAEQATQLVQSKQVKDMSFDEFELIFTSGNQQAADTVWNQVKEKPIAFAAKVIEASPTKLTLSATADDIDKNAADVTVSMVAPIPLRLVPRVGSMTQVQATPLSYTPQPFMITMEKGTLIGPEKPAAAKPASR